MSMSFNRREFLSATAAGMTVAALTGSANAADAKDVGLKLRAEIASNLIQVGFDPAAVTQAVGLPDMKHTGLPSSQLQQISTIDPADPSAAYEVK